MKYPESSIALEFDIEPEQPSVLPPGTKHELPDVQMFARFSLYHQNNKVYPNSNPC